MRSVIFTIIGIVALGWGLAALAPPHWIYGELFLAAACAVVVRDHLLTRNQALRIQNSGNSMLAGNSSWFSNSPLGDTDNHSQAFHPWDLDRVPLKTQKAGPGRTVSYEHAVHSDRQSVEQIAHDMLMQAFRQASRIHHPDHGGDPEDMRRVYAARDMILRAIHKP